MSWGVTPRQSIEEACSRLGRDAVVDSCIAILRGDEPAPSTVRMLAGPTAPRMIGDEVNGYWLRVWATRGLMWAWDDRAYDVLVAAFHDDAWRVREMACKVVARNLVGNAAQHVAALQGDPVPRVRAAASRAVMVLTERRA